MPQHLSVFLLLSFFTPVAACKGDEKTESAPAAKPTLPKEAKAPAAFTDELTLAIAKSITDADYQSWSFQPWDQAMPLIEAKLGKPSKTGDDGVLYWVAAEAETECVVFEAKNKDAQAWVSRSVVAMPDPRGIGETAAELCKKAAGIEDEIDPSAPLPPESGTTTIDVVRAGVEGNPAAWLGKEVEVSGKYISTSKSSATGDDTSFWVTISFATDVGSKESLSCSLGKNVEAPEGLVQGQAIVAKGTVNKGFGQGSLDDCTVASAE